MKNKLNLDDTLDVFACHGVGGTLGTILTGIFATKSVNPAGADGLLYGNAALLGTQLISAGAVVAFSMLMTFGIIKFVQLFTRVQLTPKKKIMGSIKSNMVRPLRAPYLFSLTAWELYARYRLRRSELHVTRLLLRILISAVASRTLAM